MKTIYPDDRPGFASGKRPGWARFLIIGSLVIVMVVLSLLFPAVLRFVEMGAREVRYLWWLILIVALGGWLIWGFGRTKR